MIVYIYTIIVLALLLIPVIIVMKFCLYNKKLKITLYVLLLLWGSRFLVGIYCIWQGQSSLSAGDTIFDSLIHALQSFSLDEDYTMYTITGKEALGDLFGFPWDVVYGLVMSVLNVCAPILGGALLLDILTNAFPHIRLYLAPRRHKFVFSEMNEAAMTLAEDIMKDGQYKGIFAHIGIGRPVLVFTDAYADETSERYSELFARAKKIGAICIRTDLLHLPLYKSHSVDYFLLDENGDDNISTLVSLLQNEEDGRNLWPERLQTEGPDTRIYVFVSDGLEEEMVNSIYQKYGSLRNVLIRVIHFNKNTAIKLMKDVPLFLPLLSSGTEGENKEKSLTVTVFGDGMLTEELIKTIFWCGQMQDVRLHIRVIGEKAEYLKKKMQSHYPEVLKSCEKDADILTVFPLSEKKEKNLPYCDSFLFIQRNIDEVILDRVSGIWKDTDYYIVALNSDWKNVELTEKIQQLVARQQMEKGMDEKKIIAPVLHDKRIAELVRCSAPKLYEAYILPFGDMQSRFSCQNVFLCSFQETAEKNASLYDQSMQKKELKDPYSYWSNIARAVHGPYKLFGLGALHGFIFSDKGECILEYKPEPLQISQQQSYELAWIEHRRWNAFLRTCGFSAPTKKQYDAYYALSKAHKNISQKLHPCLVESQITPFPLQDTVAELVGKNYDALDYASVYACFKEGVPLEDRYKKWDYWEYDGFLKQYIQ